MKDFNYYAPTEVVFGKQSEEQVAMLTKKYGGTKVLVHYGGSSAKRSGLLDKICGLLGEGGIDYVTLGGVVPNPRLSKVNEGIALCRNEKVDFILAVGGGSVIDSAKAIAYGTCFDGDVWDIYLGKATPTTMLPVASVLTLPAAGSEMSDSCVLTNEEFALKRGINGSHNRMTFAFMNPANTVTVSAWQTAAGTVDIMIHTMERFLTDEEATPLTDNIAVGIMRRVIECGALLRDNPADLNARADIMWASSLAHNDLTGCGRHKTFTAHKIEHDFSGLHDNITHGAGLSVIFPAWVMHEYKMGPERFAEWAVRIWDAERGEDLESTIKDGVHRMRAFYKSLGMPVTIEELGITPDEYEKLADLTTAGGTRTLPSFGHALTKEDIIDLYRLAERKAVEE